MWDLRSRPIGELSGGQQQRVFIARSLAQETKLFCWTSLLRELIAVARDYSMQFCEIWRSKVTA
ncbi:ATP-binding cassette domain-containing protein [Synechococcus elongatus IITB5]